jgi:hypothetical protein
MSWMTSLRWPPVRETASGMPCASLIRWCLEPGRARSTGLGPVLGRLSSPAHASSPSGLVVMPQKVSTLESTGGAGSNLAAQDIGKSAFVGFDDGAGVVCDQSAKHGVGVLHVAQVSGAVECVQVRGGQVGRVADVVQPCGGFQEIGVSAENGCQAPCSPGDALDVCPAAGEGLLAEFLCELFGPCSQRVHVTKSTRSWRCIWRSQE